MNRTVRHATLTVADAAAEGLDMVTVVIGGAIGAWAGYTYSPDTWSGDWRLAFAGGVAVVAAVAVNSLAELFLTPLRRLLTKARTTTRPTSMRTAPATLDEGLAQVVGATEDDAAARAASAAWRIDKGDNFLRDEDRWRGYEDGEASFYLAPGVWLHHCTAKGKYGDTEPRYTLLTGDGDQPVVITSMEQIRQHLTARAAGLPVSVSPKDDDRDDFERAHADLAKVLLAEVNED
ncbi:hypothetical protein AB0N77_37640 [Streptomyces misionensis]|uniref:hypothetical protein n=1 Tax=Streptomyces misionensis TaxID=67331 RepID=UPI003419A45D